VRLVSLKLKHMIERPFGPLALLMRQQASPPANGYLTQHLDVPVFNF